MGGDDAKRNSVFDGIDRVEMDEDIETEMKANVLEEIHEIEKFISFYSKTLDDIE